MSEQSPIAAKWTGADHSAAETQGWWLAARDDGYWQIQRFDNDPAGRFASDHEARAFVSQQARAGSWMHQKALHLEDTPHDQ